jgi:hypothetical protein
MSLGRPPARAHRRQHPPIAWAAARARVAATAANPGSPPSRSRWYSSSRTKARTQLRGPARIIGAPRSTVYLDTTGTPPAETA